MADAAADVEEHGGAGLQTAKDLFAGAVGGVAQVLLGSSSFTFSPPRSSLPGSRF